MFLPPLLLCDVVKKHIEVIIDIISKLININIIINLINKLLPGILILVFIIFIIDLVKETLWNTIKEFASLWRKKELNSRIFIKLFASIWFWWAIVASAMSFKAIYADIENAPTVGIFREKQTAPIRLVNLSLQVCIQIMILFSLIYLF